MKRILSLAVMTALAAAAAALLIAGGLCVGKYADKFLYPKPASVRPEPIDSAQNRIVEGRTSSRPASPAALVQEKAGPSAIRVDLLPVTGSGPPIPAGESQGTGVPGFASASEGQILLNVARDPAGWPKEAAARGSISILLRLPVGVELASEGWETVELPAEEKKDSSGPWKLFGRTVPVGRSAETPNLLASEPISLRGVEDGVNWVITVRARLVQGQTTWQAFGVIFATRQAGVIEFHAVPKTSHAQTN